MAMERRRNGQYYYRKVWRNGTCVSEYVGGGLIANLSAFTDGKERHERTMARLALEDFIEKEQRVDRLLDEHHVQVKKLVAAVLQRLGYHQHKRQWRKARVMSNRNQLLPVYTDQEMDEYMALSKAATGKKQGSPEIKRLKDYADKHPGLFNGFWMLTHSSMANVLDQDGIEERHRVHFEQEALALKRSLGSKTATPLEVLLIDDIVLCWLRLQLFEHAYSSAHRGTGVSLAKAEYLEKRLSATRRRYLQAIETLARVRALLVRAGVQVNMAQQMVVQNG